jgi:quinolinate synthase|tara:strand:- start:570 stop:1535 length:966 start_codon:yes stop_codon:yes gene_type:complete
MTTDILYKKVSKVIPEMEWQFHSPYVDEINKLKKEKNAVILAHNYMTPEIYHCVADIVGDSLKLAQESQKTKADTIIVCGVNFMADTAKIMNPSKTVLIPDPETGCSLAESITDKDVRLLKERYPGVPVVTYVNTSADVKAETDICCTSGNAIEIIESLGVDKVIFLPDEYLAKNVANQTKVKIITWHGTCIVHERFTAKEIREYRKDNPGITILAHPECTPEVVAEVDFTGSTSKMSNYVKEKQPNKVLMVTECSMSDNVSVENPNVEFVRPCNLCPHMKRISLVKVLESLMLNIHEVKIDQEVLEKARLPIERMLQFSK